MRNWWSGTLASFLLIAGSNASLAQDLDVLSEFRLAMKRLDFLVGQWQGEGSIGLDHGEGRRLRATETVQLKLDGLLLTIEGSRWARRPDGEPDAILQNTFAIVSYDPRSQGYRVEEYTALGGQGEHEATVGEGAIEWTMYTPKLGNVRRSIRLNEEGEWVETHEYSRDGTTWHRFFQMTLRRIKRR